MFEFKQVTQHFIKQPDRHKLLASFSLCLQTLPECALQQLSAAFGEKEVFSISPSPEMMGQQWLAFPLNDRWQSETEAIDWAYNMLEGRTVNLFSATKLVSPSFHSTPITRLYTCKRHQRFGYKEQETIFENELIASPLDRDLDEEIMLLNKEIIRLGRLVRETDPLDLIIWNKSLLDLALIENRPFFKDLRNVLENLPLSLLTFSTNASTIYLSLASSIMEQSIPENLTDAEILDFIMPWGSRTYMFEGMARINETKIAFSFCYMKPFSSYPPIQIGIPSATLQKGEASSLLDQLLAYLMLNPDLF